MRGIDKFDISFHKHASPFVDPVKKKIESVSIKI